MKLSALIRQLQQIQRTYGDVPITDENYKPMSWVEIELENGDTQTVRLYDDDPGPRAGTTRPANPLNRR